MSIASQIDRINGEVSSQSTIIDEISTILDGKTGTNTKINKIAITWTMNNDGEFKYTDTEGNNQTVPLEFSTNESEYTNIDIDKNIIINTSSLVYSGYEITISVSNGVLSIDFYDKGFGPTA